MRDGGVSQETGALKMSFLLCGFCGGLKSCSSVAAVTSGEAAVERRWQDGARRRSHRNQVA